MIRVRHVAQVNPAVPGWDAIPDDEVLTFVPLEAVWPRDVDFSRRRTKQQTESGYTRFQDGDVVIPKITPTFEGDRSTWVNGMPTKVGTGTTELHVVRAADAEPRYLDYLFSCAPFLQGGKSEMIGVAGQKRVPDDFLRNFPVPISRQSEQRAIADYLDAETARIDALITKKQQLIHLLEERRPLQFREAIQNYGCIFPTQPGIEHRASFVLPTGWAIPKLSNVLKQLTNGYVGPTREILRDSGVRYIQGMHIKKGRIDFDRRHFFVEQAWHNSRPRTTLRPRDVLIVQTGDIGQCAVVPDDYGEANCHALLIARGEPGVLDGRYLAAYLQSRFGLASLLRLATGALHPHLEFGIRDAPVLLPPPEIQDRIVSEIAERQKVLDSATASITEQVQLLSERRQALITAAVTGQFTVPGVA